MFPYNQIENEVPTLELTVDEYKNYHNQAFLKLVQEHVINKSPKKVASPSKKQ